MSKYEAAWTRWLRRNNIRETLDRLRQHEDEDICDETDAPGVRRKGERNIASWNHRIKINSRENLSGNAAHLNCLGKMIQHHLRPKEHLWLETIAVEEDGLKLCIYFEKARKEDV